MSELLLLKDIKETTLLNRKMIITYWSAGAHNIPLSFFLGSFSDP